MFFGLRALSNFYERRIKIPVKWDGLVLDIGSGEKPHWRADVLCDFYPDEEFSVQRSGGGHAHVTKPMVIGNVEKLPFKDNAFDFVIASHLLEHIPDVEKACQELIRVAKAGYIEVPSEGQAKIHDLDSHLWYCKKKGKKLVFTAKDKRVFDEEVYKFADELIKRKVWYPKVIHPNFDLVGISIWWEDHFDFEVNGQAHPELLTEIDGFHEEAKPAKNRVPLLRKLVIGLTKLIFWHKSRQEDFDLIRLLQCPESGETDLEEIKPGVFKGKKSGEIIRVELP